MFENSIITLKEDAVKNNIAFLHKRLGSKVRISAVVKANAYGHGIEQIVPLFEKSGINHYSVFYYSEAIRVLNCLKGEATIMIMGWISNNDIINAVAKGFQFYIFDLERLQMALEAAKKLNVKAYVHLEAETGMNRSGLNADEIETAVAIIKNNDNFIHLAGFCTHLAGAESVSNHLRIQNQLKKYQKLLSILEKNQLKPEYKHVANSAAAFVYPKYKMDLVRIGIMLYGFWSSTEVFIKYINNKQNKTDPLKSIMGWHSQIMAIKNVKSGEFIGYGISYLAQTDTKTALIPIGYSYGYSRSLSNKGRILVRGHRCSVIGVVNMNMIIVDITNIPDAEVGDEVVLIGKQHDLEIKVSAFSDISNQLNYEVLAHLSESITRKVI